MQRLGSRCAHLLAGFGTGATSSRTRLHLLVIAHLFAALGAGSANFRTRSTHFLVRIGLAEHEIKTCYAALGAIDEQFNVIGSGMFPTFAEAVDERFSTRGVTLGAI
jgi:hypothetical protein